MLNPKPDSKEMEYIIKSNFDQEYKDIKFNSDFEKKQKFQRFKQEFIEGYKTSTQPSYNHRGERFLGYFAGLGVIKHSEKPEGELLIGSDVLDFSEKKYNQQIDKVEVSARDRGLMIGITYKNLDSALSKENSIMHPRVNMTSNAIGIMNLLGVKYDGNIEKKINEGIGEGQKPLVAEAVGTLLLRYDMMEMFEGIFGKANKVCEELSDNKKEGKGILTTGDNNLGNKKGENILVRLRRIPGLEEKVEEDFITSHTEIPSTPPPSQQDESDCINGDPNSSDYET